MRHWTWMTSGRKRRTAASVARAPPTRANRFRKGARKQADPASLSCGSSAPPAETTPTAAPRLRSQRPSATVCTPMPCPSTCLARKRRRMRSPLDSLRALRRAHRQSLLGRWLSPVRRFSRIAPQPGRRLCALTFDDGPTAGITERLLAALIDAGARGTFDVIGSTAENYPDRPGAVGTPAWNGLRYDHYAAFQRDGEAGVASQPELARRLADAGCELANHTYRHVQFAAEPFTYRRRAHLTGGAAVAADCRRLEEALR